MTGKYIHIGSAKCASKSLQQGFFSKHPDLMHLGMGTSAGMTTWPDDDLQRVVEVDIRYKKELIYDAAAVQAVFQPKFAAAASSQSVKRVGLSFENLSCTMTYDVDVPVKARRLHDVFGADTKIIFIIRNQFDFIKSFYAEYLASGADVDFTEFVNYMIVTQFRSVISDMLYHRVYAVYAELFGAENLFVYPLEWLKDPGLALIPRLCEFLEIAPFAPDLPKLNPSLDGRQLHLISLVNKRMQHNFGSDQMRITHGNRLTNYLKHEFDSGQLMDTFLDMQLLNSAYGIAQNFGEKVCPTPLAMEYSDWHRDYLGTYFAEDNRAMGDLLGADLAALGYPGL